METQAYQARPHAEIIAEVMDVCLAKSEHEWAAFNEIKRLRLGLQNAAAWVTHWQMDRAHKLMPTEGSLAEAICDINDALNE